jgi:hypothetical protein
MSSSATTAAATATATPVVASVHQPAPDPSIMVDDTALPMVDEVDVSYGKAIVIGSVVGILLFTAAMWLIVKALAPEWSAGAVTVIAVWCGIWSGLFLGGTIAVGRWSMKHGH